MHLGITPSLNDAILDKSELGAFADYVLIETPILKFVLAPVENILRKAEIAGYQHFLIFPQGFQSMF